MYELIEITRHNFYIQAPTKVGVYESAPGQVWLIDAGSDKDAGRKVWKHITERGWTLQGILATHSNADHIGGAALIRERSGCGIYAAAKERCFIEHTVFEPSLLYGACPPKALRGKFLMASGVPCMDIRDAPLPPGLEIIALPGHFLEMFGVRTPEGVFFCADAVFSQAVVEKYHINFVYDVAAALDTLAALPGIPAKWYLPAHADLTEDIAPLAAGNREKMLELIALLQTLCREPRCFEDVLKGVFDHYGLRLDFPQYVLAGSSVRSYLAYLLDGGQAETIFQGNKLLWHSL